MKKISAEIVADSISEKGYRITTFLLTYPRIIHSELMTHRMFSRNAASSRAIPFEKMVKMVEEDPFIPIAWQFDHKGMQGNEYVTEESDYGGIEARNESWLQAKDFAIQQAKDLSSMDTTKQLCNRLLEPFMWHTVLVTATEYDNFFELRCPKYKLIGIGGEPVKSRKDWLEKMKFSSALHPSQYPKTEEEWWLLSESGAEIHIQALAEAMWDAMNESIPNQLESGQWHIPFGDKIVEDDLLPILYKVNSALGEMAFQKVKIAVARCARLSYMTFDGEIDYKKDIKLHDTLLESKHMSPFEHVARCMNDFETYCFRRGFLTNKEESLKDTEGWCNNFKGWIPYRYIVEHESN